MEWQQLALLEAQQLLNERPWAVDQGMHRKGQQVVLLADPFPSAEANAFHVPLTIYPLTRRGSLARAAITLHEAQTKTTCYGRLNQRGQITFRNLTHGQYEMTPQLAHDWSFPAAYTPTLVETATALLVPIPFSSADPIWRDAADTLRLTRSESQIEIEVKTAVDDGTLLALAYRPANQTAAPDQLLLVPLAWDASRQIATGLVRFCETTPIRIRSLPLQIWPPQVPVPVEIIHQSIICTPNNVRAQLWAQVLSRYQMWELAITDYIQRLSQTVSILIDQGQAVFNALASSGIPWHSTPLTTRSENPVPVGWLWSDSENGWSVRLTLNDVSALSIQIIQTETQQPLPRARLTLLDQQAQWLSSKLCNAQGRMTFEHLPPMAHNLKITHEGQSSYLPLEIITSNGQAADAPE